ncbi:MAG: TetR/AcrR family transcriptional regulator [Methylophilus sp.]|uniref:TetR/AcrR family transcriptional regulator n=1 Tax=Methylophilus sp. TaxID=29541 RepID=UPI003F9F95D7
MQTLTSTPTMEISPHKVKAGRPKAGTEQDRHALLLEQALEIFMLEGVAQTSIGRIAAACGVSTRTIYERFENKYALLIAAIKHMVEKDVSAMVQVDHLSNQTLHQVLTEIGRFMLKRVLEPRMLSFFKIGVAEASHLPELSRAMKAVGPERIHQMLADIFSFYAAKNLLPAQDFKRAAESYCELLIAAPRLKALFGVLEPDWDAEAHLAFVVNLFLHGLQGMEPANAVK